VSASPETADGARAAGRTNRPLRGTNAPPGGPDRPAGHRSRSAMRASTRSPARTFVDAFAGDAFTRTWLEVLRFVADGLTNRRSRPGCTCHRTRWRRTPAASTPSSGWPAERRRSRRDDPCDCSPRTTAGTP